MQHRRWQQTMLRIKNPEVSVPFYRDVLGFTHIDTLDFDRPALLHEITHIKHTARNLC
jgi:catechol 2,3-dioxygenase-like lactoylglutathione lyase family enzyme